MGEYVRVGGSAASIINGDDQLQASLYGGDGLIQYEPIELRGEYIMRQNDKHADQVDISGYYIEGVFDTHKWSNKEIYLVGGYSAVEYKNVELSEIEDKLTQITFGAGFNLNENASLRFEYEIEDSDSQGEEKQAIGQFVVSF
jgi:predicted porin